MSDSSLDRVLATIDAGLATAPTDEPAYGGDRPGSCVRCYLALDELDAALCPACRAYLAGETDVDPKAYRSPFPAIVTSPFVPPDLIVVASPALVDAARSVARSFGLAARDVVEALERLARAFARPPRPPWPAYKVTAYGRHGRRSRRT